MGNTAEASPESLGPDHCEQLAVAARGERGIGGRFDRRLAARLEGTRRWRADVNDTAAPERD